MKYRTSGNGVDSVNSIKEWSTYYVIVAPVGGDFSVIFSIRFILMYFILFNVDVNCKRLCSIIICTLNMLCYQLRES